MSVPRAYTENYDKIKQGLFKQTPPQLYNVLNTWVSKNMKDLIQGNMNVHIVVDANIVIGEALSLVKHNDSCLLSLSDYSIIKLKAPQWIREELDSKIPGIAKKKHIVESVLREKANLIMQRIQLQQFQPADLSHPTIAQLQKRDPKDVPYVCVYLLGESHAILTNDKDIHSLRGVNVLKKPGELKRILYKVEEGALSVFLLFDVLPVIAKWLGRVMLNIFLAFMEMLHDFGTKMWNSLKKGASNLANWFSNLSPGQKWAVGICAVIAGIIAANKIQEHWEEIKACVKEITDRVRNFLSQVAQIIGKFGNVAINIVNLLLIDIQEVQKLYGALNQKGAVMGWDT